jgi:hypothetical protein
MRVTYVSGCFDTKYYTIKTNDCKGPHMWVPLVYYQELGL